MAGSRPRLISQMTEPERVAYRRIADTIFGPTVGLQEAYDRMIRTAKPINGRMYVDGKLGEGAMPKRAVSTAATKVAAKRATPKHMASEAGDDLRKKAAAADEAAAALLAEEEAEKRSAAARKAKKVLQLVLPSNIFNQLTKLL